MGDNSPSIEEQVNNLLAQETLPEDLDPVLAFAVTAEKRRRDTQSAYTKTNMEAKKLRAANEKLLQSWESDAVQALTPQEQTELEELKAQDPDAWRIRLNEIERSKRSSVSSKAKEFEKEADQMTALEIREAQLVEFNEKNPEYAINDEVIENDIPPRLTRKLQSGEIEFTDFLEECKKYMSKGKVLQKPDTPLDDPDLSSVAGGSAPSDESRVKQDKDDYTNEIY